jgi:hypothetical protein
METLIQETNSEIKQNENGLKHGQFKTTFKTSDKTFDYIINPPTQNDLAEGWRQVVPRKRKDSTIHHFSIYLSELPSYLWKNLQTIDNNNEYYKVINDGIYQYSVKMSKHDGEIQKLYKLVMSQVLDKNQIYLLYDYLEKQRVKGWLMIRAKNIIGNC